MADVIRPDFGGRPVPRFALECGNSRSFSVGVDRTSGLPMGDEMRVMMVPRSGQGSPICVAAVIATPAGEEEAERIGNAVLAALRHSDGLPDDEDGLA